MPRKVILFSILAFLFLPQFFAFANLEISEIMYDLKTGSDTGREWIEVFNNSDKSIDISDFRFFEGDINHKLKLVQGDGKVDVHSYAIIVSDPVKFKIDWPSFGGAIFDSTFSLSNSGESLAIKDGESILDQYAYSGTLGGAGDGKSLQKIAGVWKAGTPTLGAENKIIYVPPPAPKTEKVAISAVSSNTKIDMKKDMEIPEIPTLDDSNSNESLNEETESENNKVLYNILLFPVIFSGVGAVYFIRKRKKVENESEDFEILDE